MEGRAVSDVDGKCGALADFSLWDGTKLRCLHDLEHPGRPHSWEKYRNQFTIFGGINREEIMVRFGMMCPCGEDHDESTDAWKAVRNLVEKLGALVTVTIGGVGSWKVPRVYIALHGLKAQDLPTLAQTYGWAPAEGEQPQ